MKKKATRYKAIVALVSLGFVMLFLSNCVFLWPVYYKDNPSLDAGTNAGIKSVVLDMIKADLSSCPGVNEERVFTTRLANERAQYKLLDAEEDARRGILFDIEKCLFVDIEEDFMDSVRKTGKNTYYVRIQVDHPGDSVYNTTVIEIDGRFLVSEEGIDP